MLLPLVNDKRRTKFIYPPILSKGMSNCLINKILGRYHLEGSEKTTVKEMAEELLNDQEFRSSSNKVRRTSYACKLAYNSYLEIQNGVNEMSQTRNHPSFAYN